MWFWWGGNVVVSRMNACVRLHSGKRIAFEFINNNSRAERRSCRESFRKTTGDIKRCSFFFSLSLFLFLSGKANTAHPGRHTEARRKAAIDASAAALRASRDFTLIDYFAVDGSWLASWRNLLGAPPLSSRFRTIGHWFRSPPRPWPLPFTTPRAHFYYGMLKCTKWIPLQPFH